MSYANIFELSQCLEDCLRYCDEYPKRDHCQSFSRLLSEAGEELKIATAESDQRFSQWQMEEGDGRLAWKHLARELKKVQNCLERVNAIGFVDQNVMYWDTGRLVDAVDEMIRYLGERTQDLDFAEEAVGKLERQKNQALSDVQESNVALKDYMRFSRMRSDALDTTVNVIASFRRAVRRELGRQNQEYQSIQWPQAIAPDEPVL